MSALLVFDEAVPTDVARSAHMAISGVISDRPDANELPATKQFLMDCGLLSCFQNIANRVNWLGPFLRAQINPTSRLPSVHNHGTEHALLYYVRTVWEDSWMGGTIFFDEKRTRVTGLVKYVPSRIVVIPMGLTHSMLPTVFPAPEHRITITAFYGVKHANPAG